MKWPASVCQFNSSVAMPFSRFAGRGFGDTRMWDIYVEYADIAAADEPIGRIKARLAALSACAESQGLTGYAAFDGLRRLSTDLHAELLDTFRFSLFYRFVFFMCRERGQKSISVSTAVDAWRLSLTGRFRLLDQWCSFVLKTHQRYSISEDTWSQVLEFSRSVHEDLSNYDPEGAWPVLVDEFVDKMYSLESTTACDGGVNLVAKLSTDEDTLVKALSSKPATLPGMPASAGSKRRRRDPKDEAAQVESVNSIAQLLAEMPSPLSCKRVRSSECLAEVSDPMEETFDQIQGLWERRESVDDEMVSGSIEGSPVHTHRVLHCEPICPIPRSPMSKFNGRGFVTNLPLFGGPDSQDFLSRHPLQAAVLHLP